jgi:hypothetical protein
MTGRCVFLYCICAGAALVGGYVEADWLWATSTSGMAFVAAIVE